MENKILVIVESSAKCNKIQGYLGKNYIVKASMGHIKNIDKKLGLKAVDLNNNYKTKYKVIDEKKKYLVELKRVSKKVKEVIIASDLDREGEAIGYHLIQELKLNIKDTKRIIFNEISKKAITDSIKNPKNLDINMVNSQMTRQILDYLIGFTISPLLWKFYKNNLSAGRCQSTCLHLLNEKEKIINDYKAESFYVLNGDFICNKNKLVASLDNKFSQLESLDLLNDFKDAEFKIYSINKKQSSKSPPAPYVTTTIQQDASNLFNMPPKITMKYLQEMYEKGLTTYMRTDSIVISETCSETIKEFIVSKYGNQYYKKNIYKNKVQNAQEAHECIRPVDINLIKLDDSYDESIKKLYNIVWKRTVASHMKDLKTKLYNINIKNNLNAAIFVSKLETPVFLGYKKIYNEVSKDDSKIVNSLKQDDVIQYDTIICYEKYSNNIPRYTEASLIKALEKKGIGRPSTYSNIIDVLFKREYIEKKTEIGKIIKVDKFILDNDKIIQKKKVDYTLNKQVNKLFITDLGILVDTFMAKHFTNIINYEFTKDLEHNLDEVALGNKNYIDVIDKLYKALTPSINKLKNTKSEKDKLWNSENKKKLIGVNCTNKIDIYYYKSKYNNVIQQGDKIIGLHDKKDINSIDLNICIDLFGLPKNIGKYNNNEIILCYGSYGFYIKYKNKNYGFKRDSLDISLITLKDCIDLINNSSKKLIKKISEKIFIYEGKYGPYIIKYIKNKKPKIVSISNHDLESIDNLTYEDCNKILQQSKKK
uniref:DNA topoisomerase n=1 Tax=viral metagenome TaxID=1070528 RepID=A0A6C0IXJ4_9ZZZZ